MSATPTLPDPQTAYNTLFEGVHSRIFFTKCAQAGIQPRSREEAQWMLETVGKLRQVREIEKTASVKSSPFQAMSRHLDTVLQKAGYDVGHQAEEADLSYKQAAAQLAADPMFFNATLSLKIAEAEQVAASLGVKV